jgi:hypothetical protein
VFKDDDKEAKMKRSVLIVGIGVLFVLGIAGCGPREYTEYAFADVCESAESREYITVNGVLRIPNTVFEVHTNMYRIHLVEDIDQPTPFLELDIDEGTKNNQMHPLTDNFILDDIKIQTDDGQIVSHGDAVTVSGFYRGSCALAVEIIKAR